MNAAIESAVGSGGTIATTNTEIIKATAEDNEINFYDEDGETVLGQIHFNRTARTFDISIRKDVEGGELFKAFQINADKNGNVYVFRYGNYAATPHADVVTADWVKAYVNPDAFVQKTGDVLNGYFYFDGANKGLFVNNKAQITVNSDSRITMNAGTKIVLNGGTVVDGDGNVLLPTNVATSETSEEDSSSKLATTEWVWKMIAYYMLTH